MNTVNLSAKYGRIAELDSKVGNIRGLIKSCNPARRYLLITNENVKEHFVNLIEARWTLKQHLDMYREITEDDLAIEVSEHPKRIKGGKSAKIIEVLTDRFVVEFRGIKYEVLFSASLASSEIPAECEGGNIPTVEVVSNN